MGQPIQYRPTGGLNKDSHIQDVKEGDYLDAKDIQFMSDASNNTSLGQEPVRGNRFLFEIPNITSRELRYRNEFHYPNPLTDTARNAFIGGVSFSYNVTVGNDSSTQSSFFSNFSSALQPTIPPGIVNNINNDTTNIFIEFDVNWLSNTPNDLTFSDNSNDGLTCGQWGIVRQAIPNNTYLLGTPLKIVSSFNINNDVFLISCIDPNPEYFISDEFGNGYSVAINPIGVILFETYYDIDITFDNPHGILVNDEIDIEFNYNESTGTYDKATKLKVTSVSGNIIRVNWRGPLVPDLLIRRSRITKNPTNYAELGVFSNSSQSYIKLIELIDFNISSEWQPELVVESNSERFEIYWTDGVNVPRSVYYYIDETEGDFIENGCVYGIRPKGTYIFDNISLATSLIQKDTIRINPTDVNLSGGKLFAGTKRYTISPIGLGGVNSDYTPLSRPINVYFSNGVNYPENWRGDSVGSQTTKSVDLMIYGIPKGVFQSLDIVVVEFADVAQTATVFSKKKLGVFETYFSITHTGYEPESTVLDVTTIPSINQIYKSVKNISALDNRLIMSNVDYVKKYDLSEICSTFTYGIFRSSIVAQPTIPNQTGISSSLFPGDWKEEYINPMNNANSLGYMHNETYRFGVRFKYKGLNEWSDVFWVADVNITTDPTKNDSRCTTVLEDYNLTSTELVGPPYNQTMRVVRVPYVKINIDIPGDYVLEDDKLFSDVFDYEAEVMRAECVKEVLVTGASVAMNNATSPATVSFEVGENVNFDRHTFFSADLQSGVQTILSSESYVYKTLGTPPLVDYVFLAGSPPNAPQRFDDFDGNFGALGDVDSYNDFNILGGGSFISGALRADIYNDPQGPVFTTQAYASPSPLNLYSLGCYIFQTSATVTAPAANTNTNMRLKYGQIFKEISDKYGDKKFTTYISCNNIQNSVLYNLKSNNWGLISVFGGDTYTQKTIFKIGYNDSAGTPGGVGFSIYAQNRINAQMIRYDYPLFWFYSPYFWYPTTHNTRSAAVINWLGNINDVYQGFTYSLSYTPRNPIQNYVAYNSDTLAFDNAPTRIVWSNVKQNSSPLDGYRYFAPLNFKDLQLSKGKIVAHHSVNGELFTWQNREFQRQFFNTRGTLTVSDGTQVVIGDGSVMSRDGVDLSEYGTNQKWAVIKGKSAGGKDVVYWLNTEHRRLVRFGADGTVLISDLRGIKRDLFDRLTSNGSINYDRPASGKGIHGVWNDRFNEALFTFLGDSDSFTMVFSEAKNKFTNELSIIPHIYIPYKSNYMTPSYLGTPETNKVYIHDSHEDCVFSTWYDGELITEPYFEFVINALPDTSKRWEAIMVNCQNTPFRNEFKTEGDTYPLNVPYLESYLDADEFEKRENYYYSPIKNDSTVTVENPSGLNNTDSSQMYGKWLRVKFKFESGLYQNVRDFVVKILQRNRNFNR